MRPEPFELERWQSVHEHAVGTNLSESGVLPLTVGELLALPGGDAPPDLAALRLGYAPTDGPPLLRERIAALYPGAGPEHVLVTTGGAEANLLVVLDALEAGDEAVVLEPNYLQVRGLVRALGATARPWRLRPELGWRPDPAELDALVGPRTRLVALTTPSNPTGRVLDDATLDAAGDAAARAGALLLSDEIYRGAELDGTEAPSAWGRSDALAITSGLAKAYGLPGLRIGWVASPDRARIERLWALKDHTTIAPATPSAALAACALEPARRRAVLDRTRRLVRAGRDRALGWAEAHGRRLRAVPPEAGAILWLELAPPLAADDRALVERLRVEEDVLVVAGSQMGAPGCLRIGIGGSPDELGRGLERLGSLLERLAP